MEFELNYHGLIYSGTVCEALGIDGQRLADLANRESMRRSEQWEIEEVKRLARRLVVVGSPEERVRAADTLKALAKLSAAMRTDSAG